MNPVIGIDWERKEKRRERELTDLIKLYRNGMRFGSIIKVNAGQHEERVGALAVRKVLMRFKTIDCEHPGERFPYS